jgi:hypothetical protein
MTEIEYRLLQNQIFIMDHLQEIIGVKEDLLAAIYASEEILSRDRRSVIPADTVGRAGRPSQAPSPGEVWVGDAAAAASNNRAQ